MKSWPNILRLTAAFIGLGTSTLPNAQAAATSKLAYYMNYGDSPNGTHYQIYLVNPDGTQNNRIVHPDTNDSDPYLSPDGTKIVLYTTGTGITSGVHFMNTDGTNLALIPNTSDCYYAVWSPDGKRLAAVGGDEFVTFDADGSNRHAIGDAVYSVANEIQWSPDGTKVVFTARDVFGTHNYYVLVANADGTGTPVKLSTDDNAEYDHPVWSPDGTQIAVRKFGGSVGYGIYLLDAATGAEAPLAAGYVDGDYPAWSPDSKQVAYESYADDSYGNIGIRNRDGSSFHVLSVIGQANGLSWGVATATATQEPAPVITSTGLGPIPIGQPFDYTITTDGTVAVVKFAADILPAGLSLNTGTGEIFGTVQAADIPTYTSITITATSAAGVSTSKDLPLTFSTANPAAFTVALIKPVGTVNVVAGTSVVAKAKIDLTRAGSETVASVSFLLDGKLVGTLGAKPYKLPVALDGSLSGAHTLTASAMGSDGRVASSAPITINVAARFVDLAASATFKPKIGADGTVTIKGQYSLSNLGNTASGPFKIGFYLSNDATFDSTDLSVNAIAAQLLGKDPGFDKSIPGLPANTTLSSTDLNTILPKLKIAFPPSLVSLLTRYSGKYLLAVVDPDNTAGEDASTRGNNVIVYQIP